MAAVSPHAATAGVLASQQRSQGQPSLLVGRMPPALLSWHIQAAQEPHNFH